MSENLNLVSFFLLTILVLAGFLFLSTYKGRRAVSKVVAAFYQHNALDVQGAKTLRELGLERPDFVQRMMKPRDYKQYALQFLIRKGVLLATEDGRLYLVEEKLDQTLRKPKEAVPPSGQHQSLQD